MMKCPKCAHTEVKPTYIPEGKLAYLDAGTNPLINTEFLSSSLRDRWIVTTAKTEHLRIHCYTCKYSWREHCADRNSE